MTLAYMPGCGAAGADRGEVFLGYFDGLVHLVGGFGEGFLDHGLLLMNSAPDSSGVAG